MSGLRQESGASSEEGFDVSNPNKDSVTTVSSSDYAQRLDEILHELQESTATNYRTQNNSEFQLRAIHDRYRSMAAINQLFAALTTEQEDAVCDRNFAGTHTVTKKNGVACCPGCGMPVSQHRREQEGKG